MAGISGQFRQEFTNPAWAKDYGNREHLLPGGARVDASQFPRDDATTITLSAAASAGDVALTVTALGKAVKPGPVRFNGGQYANVTANAAAGATSLTVEALSADIPNGSVAVYNGSGRVEVRSATVLGRTLAERDAGTGFGPAADTDAVVGTGEVYVLYHTIDDALSNADADIYRHGGGIDETHFPGWAALSATIKTYLRTHYQCTVGAD